MKKNNLNLETAPLPEIVEWLCDKAEELKKEYQISDEELERARNRVLFGQDELPRKEIFSIETRDKWKSMKEYWNKKIEDEQSKNIPSD